MGRFPETRKIVEALEKKYDGASTALNFSNALQLLIATILSAQCTDKRVNMVTSDLFPRYENLLDLADASLEDIEKIIYSTGFYKNKARNIRKSTRIIRDKFSGEVPSTMEKLLTLPGVARKTANIVLFHYFGKNEGIAVDTHVKRVSKRLGLTENTNPQKIERDLMALFDRDSWGKISDLFIQHGRETCKSRNPECRSCIFMETCPSSRRF